MSFVNDLIAHTRIQLPLRDRSWRAISCGHNMLWIAKIKNYCRYQWVGAGLVKAAAVPENVFVTVSVGCKPCGVRNVQAARVVAGVVCLVLLPFAWSVA